MLACAELVLSAKFHCDGAASILLLCHIQYGQCDELYSTVCTRTCHSFRALRISSGIRGTHHLPCCVCHYYDAASAGVSFSLAVDVQGRNVGVELYAHLDAHLLLYLLVGHLLHSKDCGHQAPHRSLHQSANTTISKVNQVVPLPLSLNLVAPSNAVEPPPLLRASSRRNSSDAGAAVLHLPIPEHEESV